MSEPTVEIERLVTPTTEHVNAFAHLLPQLSSASPPTLDALKAIIANDCTYLFIASVNGEIAGSLSLATFTIPTGVRAWIEDVVVDEHQRGKGIASALVHRAIEQATQIGASSIDLTSRPSRIEANRLYQQLGFTLRETNVYRFNL